MGSAAALRTVTENSLAVAHVFTQGFHSLQASQNTPIVFLIDSNRFERNALESLIRNKGWQAEGFESLADFLDRPRPLVPSCLILATSAAGSNGLEAQKEIARLRKETPIIFISGCGDIPTTVLAIKAGAVDFLVRPFRNDVLLRTLSDALEQSRQVLQRESRMSELRGCYALLTARERQVMALVVSGLLNKQVGGELGISEITVKAHRGQVMQKMRASSLPDLVRMAAQLGVAHKVIHFA
ncbi:MAG TPA: LuxR C-terminal-related transcriptional regulator [Candidatus Binatia bacterium]|nr:LuxR C-terminal-related transcriptional regulator [Candidatus Binatia bacterium]